MAKKRTKKKTPKQVEAFKHDEASRKNIPTAEYQSVMAKEAQAPIQVAIARRNRDLDPQLVWRGKDEKDWSDLVVSAPPIYIQEKIHPKVLIDDLRRQTERARADKASEQPGFIPDLFGDFNGLPEGADKTDFYQHEGNWTNRMILGDSLQVMASLAEREGLRGKVQCIYIDPPYGIKFNSNFQWSTTTRDVKDGKEDHITREPEQVRAFRDTWRDGIHSYLSYLRDRLTVARDLLRPSGSVFVQIGDENVHLLRALLDEVFGATNFVSLITYKTTTGAGSFAGGTKVLASTNNYILWYARDLEQIKYRELFREKDVSGAGGTAYRWLRHEKARAERVSEAVAADPPANAKLFRIDNLTSQTTRVGQTTVFPVELRGEVYRPNKGGWKTNREGMTRLALADRLMAAGRTLSYVRYFDDFRVFSFSNLWDDTTIAGFADEKLYVVQTTAKVIERCVLMASDPGDLVLDPTCGSGTTAVVAELWGRRWVTIDTSRVALALARSRVIGARMPYYTLAGEAGVPAGSSSGDSTATARARPGRVSAGFVYEELPHITLKSIANNTEINVIWANYQEAMDSSRRQLNEEAGQDWQEWEVPLEPEEGWSSRAKAAHAAWWTHWTARQNEIDASIVAKADTQRLYDQPKQDKQVVRVAGPFTVESLSPHRTLGVDDDDELLDSVAESEPLRGEGAEFGTMVMEHLRSAGVQQVHKGDKISFSSITPWPGKHIAAEGRYREGETNAEKRAGIFVGPEFGTVSKPDLVAAAKEAGDADFDVLIACAFNYDAHSADFDKLGRIPVLKARMNADLHMAGDLKNTGKGNLFVIFGEPDIEISEVPAEGAASPPSPGSGAAPLIQVRIRGVDVFHPQTGEVRSDGPDGIACWFIDTDYNEESFFVRHAYFLGANDPYKALKTTLKAEIDEDAWASLHSDTSRPFEKPNSGRIAVKVINHLGDEVMKVFRVE